MLSVVGTTASVTVEPAAATVTFTVVVWVTEPPTPCTVTGYAPGATFAATLICSADVSVVPVSVAGVKVPVMPAGGLTRVSATSDDRFGPTHARLQLEGR